MTNKTTSPSKPPSTLRERAEAAVRVTRTDLAAMPPEEVQRLVHELQVHQIELEMQNEELRQAHAELEQRVKERTGELQASERATRESEARLRLSVQSANIGLWDWDLITNESHFSREWKSQLGYAENEIAGHFDEWTSRIHPDDLEQVLEKVGAYIANPQGRYDVEFRLRHKDGAYRWIHAQGDVLRDAAGKPVRMLGCHIDMTERKQAEDALRASEGRFRALVEQTPDGIFVADNSGRYTDVNAAGAEMLGYQREEILGLGIIDVIMPDEIPRLAPELAQYSNGKISRVEWRFRRKDGSELCGEVVGRQLPDGGFQGILRDITERKRAEEQLKRQADMLRLSFDAIIVWRLDGTIESWNRGAALLYGYGESEAMDRATHELLKTVHPLPWPKLRAILRKHGNWEGELRHITRDGREVIVSARHQLIVGSDAVERVLETNRDITERKRAEEALGESEEKYRQLIHGLPTAIYACDAQGYITLCNAAAVRLWGREPKIGHDRWCGSHRLFTPDGKRLPHARCPMALAMIEDEPIRDAELIVERPDGSRSHVLAFPDPIHDSAGAVIGAVNMLVDITALKVTENALRSSARKLRTLSRAVEQSPASVIITSTTGEIEYVNPKFTEVTGYALEEVRGQNPRFLKSGTQPPDFYKQMWETIQAGQDWRGEFCNRKKNGELFWEFAVIAPIEDEHGTVTHFVAVKEDITERKRLEKEVLEISAREQRRIGQELHDDLCQWLTGTEFLASALAEDLAVRSPADEARARKIADAVQQANARARALAHGLVPAVIESAGLTGALRELAANAAEMFRIRCSCEGPETVEARDPVAALHVYRIAQEAITNAVRHGHAREVRILLQPEDDRMTLFIRDDGSGIPEPVPHTSGMGLRTMRYRAGIIGATLEIRPGPGGGTEIACTFSKDL